MVLSIPMARLFRNIVVVSASTIGSRITGLVRDMVVFSLLGTGAMNSAFITAFTLPNLFRRLLGEGALTSAVIPVFSDELEKGGRPGAFALLNQVLSWLALVLTALVLLLGGVCSLVHFIPNLEERWYTGADLAIVLMPYMLLICQAAIIAAALNALEYFALTALSQVWLNLAMILGIGGFGWLFADTAESRVGWLCAGVLVGGILQVVVPGWGLKRAGWHIRFTLHRSERLRQVITLFLPGVAGAAIIQVNNTVSRLLAFGLNEQAVSILYLANRLIELPLGIFATAITTVLFPAMARAASRGDKAGFATQFQQGTRLIIAITTPAAVGLAVLGEPIIALLFKYGAFKSADVTATLAPLAIFALALPLYGYATLATRGFHALKDTRYPVRVAVSNFTVNLILSIALMYPMGMNGLAWANTIANVVQCALLGRELGMRDPALGFAPITKAIYQILIAAASMGTVVYAAQWLMITLFGTSRLVCAVELIVLIPLGVGLYYLVLRWLRFSELDALHQLVRKITRR
ncbi:MAG: murein biosynthesis integral membrane protein MurJ [Verrucomicrobiota bacterium]|nr:murein biosynthesis integral membrane protein MurJ [Verrucomicrobiota bacterium]